MRYESIYVSWIKSRLKLIISTGRLQVVRNYTNSINC